MHSRFVFFPIAALLAWRAGEGAVSTLFLIFGTLGLYLMLGSGHVTADEDVVTVRSLLGRHELAWRRVRRVETSGYGTLVLHADDARLVVPPPMMWSGPEKQALRALIVEQLKERSLSVHYSRIADYRIHRNVRVTDKARQSNPDRQPVESRMQSLARKLFAILILAWPAWAFASEVHPSADAFKRLSSLVGTWEGKFEDGRAHSVAYRLTAGGTVLVETWTLGPTRESLTLYHLDGDALVATHYCPQGTQPRLQLSSATGPAERLSFVLRDGGSLQVKGRSHQHAFWIELKDADAFVRSETYVENGSSAAAIANAPADAAVTYTRARSGH